MLGQALVSSANVLDVLIKGCVSLLKAKSEFLNPKNGFRVSLLKSENGLCIRVDTLDQI